MQQIEAFLQQRSLQLGMNFGLTRMEQLLEKLDNPQRDLTFIHLAGSNGKGSTLHYIKEMLITEGYRIAAFTSPYLERINEQLSINDQPITDADFSATFHELKSIIDEMDQADNGPTEFEILTAMAFCYFRGQSVDLVLLEAGLGGRLDSTNVIEPLMSIITSISLEHTNILGDTLAKIASEKAGIIKAGAPIISGVTETEPAEVIEQRAQVLDVPYLQLTKDIIVRDLHHTDMTQSFTFVYEDTVLEQLELHMLGRHQVDNAALAVAAVTMLQNVLPVSETSIRTGLQQANWKGRFEKIATEPTIILDGAHNEAGIRVLLETLHAHYPNRNYHFVFSALRDKNYPAMLKCLDEAASAIVITEFTHERAARAEDLFAQSHHAKKRIEKNWQQALEVGMANMEKEEILIVTGSLYFLTLVREYLLGRN